MIWSDIPFASIESAGSNVLLFNLMMHYFPTGKSKPLENYLIDIGSETYDEAEAQKVWMLQVRSITSIATQCLPIRIIDSSL